MNTETNYMQKNYVIGVDVGTGSARAGVFDLSGHMLASAKKDISLFHLHGSIVEQSSNEIWEAVCASVRQALSLSGIGADQVVGIGFDATCSLVVLGEGGKPLSVSSSNDSERNIIVWMDHRAVEQADRINAIGHDVLKYVGGRISPEMETPKLLWLLENKRDVFDQAWQFMDLTDFLTWRASGDLSRSTCTVTCKWTYLAHERRWDDSYFRAIGLDALADEAFERIGQNIVAPGTSLGQGLTPLAAAQLGLREGTAVATGVIDAHAGGIGTVGVDGDPFTALAYVFGTSSCTMSSTREPVFVPGVWGPYFSAMVPDTWLVEGGQSAAGAAIEQLLSLHPLAVEVGRQAQEKNLSLPAMLAKIVEQQAGDLSNTAKLAKGLHVVPEFLGNRAPLADPHARAVIVGLGMDNDMESLIALYIAGMCGIAYGLRQIIDAQAAAGAGIECIMISGGAGRPDLVRQLLADATGKPVLAADAEESVLLGAAMLGSVAAGAYGDVGAAMAGMSRIGRRFEPQGGAIAELHDKRFVAFEKLQNLARDLRQEIPN
ncbi:FGGY-pentulose kinase family protein [Collimonas fungivorans]|uniref:FGGY-pentulose kinase family protein n=1 Tax=Collimonas fungivorans TaxID=158899 RepID=A0A127PBU8_9BURK|nr:FGGY-family carbohydrate kinase [Collimonas fungivorans]AMO94911.1 FGGY-pentulose kinase family protein [Collimonas fungivorans]